jgi:hypothetical protein
MLTGTNAPQSTGTVEPSGQNTDIPPHPHQLLPLKYTITRSKYPQDDIVTGPEERDVMIGDEYPHPVWTSTSPTGIPTQQEFFDMYPLPQDDYTPNLDTYPHLPIIKLRPGAIRQISTESIVASAPEADQALLREIMLARVPDADTFKLDRAADTWEARVLAETLERREEQLVQSNAKYSAENFVLPVDNRFQLLDGSISSAPVILLLHYPNQHNDSKVLTDQASSTRYVLDFDIEPPSPTKPGLLAVLNSFPVKCFVDGQTKGIQVAPLGRESRKTYPIGLVRVALDQRITRFTEIFDTGVSKVIFGMGQDHTLDILNGLVNSVKDRATVTEFTHKVRYMRPWEIGCPCPELSVLIDDCSGRTLLWPADHLTEPLFPYNTIMNDKERGLDTGPNDPANKPIELKFTLLKSTIHNSGFLLLSLPHPQNATLGVIDGRMAYEADLGMNLLHNILSGETADRLQFHGTIRHSQSTKKSIKDQLAPYKIAQTGTRINDQIRYFSLDALPTFIRRNASRCTTTVVATAEATVVAHPKDLLERAAHVMVPKESSVPVPLGPSAITHPRSALATQQLDQARQAKSKSKSTAKIQTSDQDWLTICECRLETRTNEVEAGTGRPFITRRTAGTTPLALHPANPRVQHPKTCYTFIPVSNTMRALVQVYERGKFTAPTPQQKEKMEEAVRLYHAGDRVEPYSEGEWGLITKKQDEAAKARKAAVQAEERARVGAEAESSRMAEERERILQAEEEEAAMQQPDPSTSQMFGDEN